MIKIRVKIKTLILMIIGILFFIFSIVPFINIELANHLGNEKTELAEKLYNNYIKYPTGGRKDEALYKKSQSLMNNYIRYYIFLGGKLNSRLIDNDTIKEVIENNERIIQDYPNSKYYSSAYKAILDTYIYASNSKELKKWIAWGKTHDNEEIRDISTLYDGYYHFVNRKYDEAQKILDDYTLDNENLDYIYYFLKGHIAFAMEDFDNALGYYENASKIGWRYKSSFFGSMIPDERRYWLSELKFHKGDNKIRGRVTFDGVGIPFVEVYIQYTNEGYSTSGSNFVAITDENGYFETIGIKKGKYDIGIGIGSPLLFDKVYLDKNIRSITIDGDMEFNFEFTTPMKVISPKPGEVVKDNKFIVEWEEVEGADYYTVYSVAFEDIENKKNRIGFGLRDENRKFEINGNKAIFDLEIINESSLLEFVSYPDGRLVNPQYIIGYFHKGSEMPIIINAYDKDGNKLNSNIPLATYYDNVPSIRIENRDLTVGENLMLNREYEKAIEYYENVLKEDSKNVEALRYLSRIYMVNWAENKKDLVKSIDYGLKLYELTGETNSLRAALFHMRHSEEEQYKDLVEKINNILNENDELRDND